LENSAVHLETVFWNIHATHYIIESCTLKLKEPQLYNHFNTSQIAHPRNVYMYNRNKGNYRILYYRNKPHELCSPTISTFTHRESGGKGLKKKKIDTNLCQHFVFCFHFFIHKRKKNSLNIIPYHSKYLICTCPPLNVRKT
jgi:hypothetical protein